MEFRQFEYFVTISELENFTRTAEVLHVSQPSVTKAIKSLEGELKLTLIDRSQKHVSLTEEGRTFLIHAQRIMRMCSQHIRTCRGFTVRRAAPFVLGFRLWWKAICFPIFLRNSEHRILILH